MWPYQYADMGPSNPFSPAIKVSLYHVFETLRGVCVCVCVCVFETLRGTIKELMRADPGFLHLGSSAALCVVCGVCVCVCVWLCVCACVSRCVCLYFLFVCVLACLCGCVYPSVCVCV